MRNQRTTATKMQKILERLETLEAQQAILRILYRYSHCLDYVRVGEWLDLFTDDGTFEVRPPPGSERTRFEGRSALATFIRGYTPEKVYKHLLIEPVITLDGKEAMVESYHTVLDEDNGSPYLRAFGRYHDRIVKCPDGQWRFKERIAVIEARHVR